jgi:hypothetical protein
MRPTTLTDITALWLSDALNLDVTMVTVEQLAADSAFLGIVARVTPTYASARGPATLIAKLPPTDPGALAVGKMLNVWHREANFYTQLAPLLPATVRTPTCYAVMNNANGTHAVLLLEDLAPWVCVDQLAGATAESARAAVQSLGAVHAKWWGAPRSAELAWVPGIDRPGAGAGLQAAMELSIDRFCARFGPVLPSHTIQWTRDFIPLVEERLGEWSQRPMTIAHADYHLGNLLIDPADPANVAVVDWQTAMFTAGASDLSFFTCTSMEPDLRRAIEPELIDLYLSTLAEHGVADSMLVHVRDDYRESILWWMVMLANNLADIATPTQHAADLFEALVTRLHAAAEDHAVGALITRG